MKLNFILCVLAAIASLTGAQSYRYSRYGRRRSSRPASRLFGSSITSRSRYDPSRRPASRPFTIPGFELAFGSPTSVSLSPSQNFQNNLGFNIGFGGPAFADPVAGLYDTITVGDGMGLSQESVAGINDFAALNPAANTRSSLSREANTAMDPSLFNSRQQQNKIGTHDSFLGSGGLGFQNVNIGITGNQDSTQFLTNSSGNSNGFTTLDLTSAATNPQLGIANFGSQLGGIVPTQNPLGAGQLNRMGAVQFIDASSIGNEALGIGLSSLGSPAANLQAALTQFEMPSGSGLVDANNLHEILSGQQKNLQNQLGIEGSQLELGANALGLDTNQLGLGSNPLGLNANQLGFGSNPLGLATNQLGLGSNPLGLDGNQLGLDNKQLEMGQNKILLDSNSLSNTLGLDGNHVIIQSEQMDLPKLGQSSLSAGNQVILDSSGGEMSILGNQIGLGNGQSLINSNQIGGELSQLAALNSAAALQGQMIGVSKGEGGTTKIVTATGEFPANSLTPQVGLGSTGSFFSPKEEEKLIGQLQNTGQMASEVKNGLLTQLTGA